MDKAYDCKPVSENRKRQLLKAINKARTYSKAYQDLQFMSREELRPLRLQLELLKPEIILREHEIDSTIVVFGSARIHSPEQAKKSVAGLESQLKRRPHDKALQDRLLVQRRLQARSRYYAEACRFAKLVTAENNTSSSPEAGRASWKRPIRERSRRGGKA